MKRNGTTGGATLSLVVDAEGKVHDVQVVKFTHQEFADAAIEAVSQWQFDPGQKNGANVNTRVTVPINFSIGGNKLQTLSEWF